MSRFATKTGTPSPTKRCCQKAIPSPKFLKNLLAPLILVQMLAACAVEGDFGRIQPTVLSKVTDQFLLNADIMTRGLNRPELDRDEIILREAGHSLTRPLELAPPRLDIPLRHPDETAPSRYERDIQAIPPGLIARTLDQDHQVLTRFGESARRVIRTYGQQMETILKYDPVLRAKKRDEARVRMQENLDYIDSVFAEFGHRLQAYHYAIGAVRAADGRFAPELEGSLAHLRDRTAALEYELKHYAGAALARGEYQEPRFASRERGVFGREPLFEAPKHPEPGKHRHRPDSGALIRPGGGYYK